MSYYFLGSKLDCFTLSYFLRSVLDIVTLLCFLRYTLGHATLLYVEYGEIKKWQICYLRNQPAMAVLIHLHV